MSATREFFDRMADRWDERATAVAEDIESILRYLSVPRDARILDAGCGTGVLLHYLDRLVEGEGRLYAVDISPAMLRRAREKHRDMDITYLVADISDLPLPSSHLDAIVCFNMFPHVDDRAGAFSEMLRTLRPGGTVLIAHDASRETVNARHRDVGGEVASHMLPEGDHLALMLEEAGLTPTRIEDGPDRYLVMAAKAAR